MESWWQNASRCTPARVPTERMSMRSSREILSQKWLLKRPHRAICTSAGVSVGAVCLVTARAVAAMLTWEAVEALTDEELESRLYPSTAAAASRPEPDCAWIHRERQRAGVTLDLLHHEYIEKHPDGLRSTAFCDRYREWLGRRGLVMRQVHFAGDNRCTHATRRRWRWLSRSRSDGCLRASATRCSTLSAR